MTQTRPDMLATQRHLRRALDSVEIGEPRTLASLSVWPLLGGSVGADYALLDAALADGSARVTEINGGSVPELRFVNEGRRPVLLADGEELLGAMQNRSLNLSILAPAGAAITIPVSCMEAGRWGYRAEHEFRRSGHVMNARLRMSRMQAVSASMRTSGGSQRGSDQGAVWRDIDTLAEELEARSGTSAINDAFERYGAALDEYAEALALRDGACGAVFALAGGPHGLDLFDAQSTFRSLYPKLIRSWSLDAIASHRQSRIGSGKAVDPRILLDRLARRRVRTYPAVGLGVDARMTRRGSRLQGAALVAGDRAVHVSAFHIGLR